MQLQLDQLIQHLEQIDQQLKALETIFTLDYTLEKHQLPALWEKDKTSTKNWTDSSQAS